MLTGEIFYRGHFLWITFAFIFVALVLPLFVEDFIVSVVIYYFVRHVLSLQKSRPTTGFSGLLTASQRSQRLAVGSFVIRCEFVIRARTTLEILYTVWCHEAAWTQRNILLYIFQVCICFFLLCVGKIRQVYKRNVLKRKLSNILVTVALASVI